MAEREWFTADEDLVFAGDLGKYLDASALRDRYKAALDRAGLRRLRFHDLRHTFTRVVLRRRHERERLDAGRRLENPGDAARYLGSNEERPAAGAAAADKVRANPLLRFGLLSGIFLGVVFEPEIIRRSHRRCN